MYCEICFYFKPFYAPCSSKTSQPLCAYYCCKEGGVTTPLLPVRLPPLKLSDTGAVRLRLSAKQHGYSSQRPHKTNTDCGVKAIGCIVQFVFVRRFVRHSEAQSGIGGGDSPLTDEPAPFDLAIFKYTTRPCISAGSVFSRLVCREVQEYRFRPTVSTSALYIVLAPRSS